MERFSVLVPTVISMIYQLVAGGGIRSYLRSGRDEQNTKNVYWALDRITEVFRQIKED